MIEGDRRLEGPTETLEVLILGGLPIRETIVSYGPFVMNTREEIIEAIRDYQAGRMGQIPPLTRWAVGAARAGREETDRLGADRSRAGGGA